MLNFVQFLNNPMDSNKLEQMRDMQLTEDFTFAIYFLNILTLPCQRNEYGIEVYLAKLLDKWNHQLVPYPLFYSDLSESVGFLKRINVD